jgi:hypothetical protein
VRRLKTSIKKLQLAYRMQYDQVLKYMKYHAHEQVFQKGKQIVQEGMAISQLTHSGKPDLLNTFAIRNAKRRN